MGSADEMPNVVIRAAVASDLPELQRVFQAAALSNVEDRAALLARPQFLAFTGDRINEGRTRVAVTDDRVLAFASTTIDQRGQVELEDLSVDPPWQRRGIGRRLVEDIAAAAREEGHRQLAVTGNRHALAFYQSAGFVYVGEVSTDLGLAPRLHLELTGATPQLSESIVPPSGDQP